MAKNWQFHFRRQELRSRRLILEGEARPPYERAYHDRLAFYSVVGFDFLSMEVSRDFDGERLLAYFSSHMGPPTEAPRVQVGGRQDEEEGALMVVEWRFAAGQRENLIRRLEKVLGQPLTDASPAYGAGAEEK